jgi:RNA polymerase sigma-70 factor, ECF subfamily
VRLPPRLEPSLRSSFNKKRAVRVSWSVTLESDARLVDRARRGDGAAFEKLVRRHFELAYTIALAELADAGDAEDAVQDSFITALERLDDCRDGGSFGPWLRQIVRNRSRSLRRRQLVRQADALEGAHPASAEDPARDLERSRLRERLESALGTLSEVQRAVVLMHDMEGYRHREIAQELGLPEGTVRSHLFYARRTLRQQLGALYPERTDG